MEKIIKYLKKYLPDILFLGGIWIFSYNILRPVTEWPNIDLTNYFTGYKVFGIMLIALALDIAIRRYFSKNNSGMGGGVDSDKINLNLK